MNAYTLQTVRGHRFITGPDGLCDADLRTRLTDAQAQAIVDALNAIAMQPELPFPGDDADQLTLFPA